MKRVVKVGGSLLGHPNLCVALDRWMAEQSPAETFVIVGGGGLIDAMRQIDKIHHCDPSWIHWQCVALLRTTFELLGHRLGDWNHVSSQEQFASLQGEGVCLDKRHLIAVDSFYRQGSSAPLPESWATTTDAIAGWLAMLIEADEVVLLKSCDVDSNDSLEELSTQGIIDSAMAALADKLPAVRFANLARRIESD